MFQQIASAPSLYQAWRRVRANRGAAGLDAVSLNEFETNLNANLRELSRSLLSEAYQPMPARFVTAVKENGKERELGILTVRDRVAQRAVLNAIEPLIEPLLLDCSFAFRQGRNVEMAAQRIIAARANGFWWTVESDVQNFFGSIDRQMLLKELRQIVPDDGVLRLLRAWLDAGALEQDAINSLGWWRQSKESLASLRLLARGSINHCADEYVAQQLGLDVNGHYFDKGISDQTFQTFDGEMGSNALPEWNATSPRETQCAVVKRLVQDGALLVLSQRALLGKLLKAKVLGVGGIALAVAVLAPKAVSAYRCYMQPQVGTLQGAPLSPLLTNYFMTPFDREIVAQNFRLIRYCDDFVIQCRTKADAQAALRAAEQSLAKRRLRMHPEKTRIIPPDGEFEFLGYSFKGDGSITPPPNVPEQMAKQIRDLARRARYRMPRVKRHKFGIEKVQSND